MKGPAWMPWPKPLRLHKQLYCSYSFERKCCIDESDPEFQETSTRSLRDCAILAGKRLRQGSGYMPESRQNTAGDLQTRDPLLWLHQRDERTLQRRRAGIPLIVNADASETAALMSQILASPQRIWCCDEPM